VDAVATVRASRARQEEYQEERGTELHYRKGGSYTDGRLPSAYPILTVSVGYAEDSPRYSSSAVTFLDGATITVDVAEPSA
jgi:hypothetical protein